MAYVSDLTVAVALACVSDRTVAVALAYVHDLTVAGTTASTIHVAYTTFDIMDPPHSQPTSLSQPPSLSAAQSQPAGAQCGAVLDAPTAETLPPCSSASADTGLPEAALRGEACIGVWLYYAGLFT